MLSIKIYLCVEVVHGVVLLYFHSKGVMNINNIYGIDSVTFGLMDFEILGDNINFATMEILTIKLAYLVKGYKSVFFR